MRRSPAVGLRFGAIGLGIASGRLPQLTVYLAPTGAGPHDTDIWALYSGGYCALGWILVGLPTPFREPSPLVARPLRASLLAGAAGAVLALVPPAGALFVVPAPLGFLVAAVAMWVYCALLALLPGVLGGEPPE